MNSIEKQDFLFFYFMYVFSNNLKCMNKISILINKEQISNVFTSIFFTYIYVVLGLQAEFCVNYMKKWFISNNMNLQSEFLQTIIV
jgi:hypothetical protein